MSALLVGVVDLDCVLVLHGIQSRVCEPVAIHGGIDDAHAMLQLLAPRPHEVAVHEDFLDVLCRLLDACHVLALLRRCYRMVAFRDGWPRTVLAVCNDFREVFQGV